jgi:hypothetical protein
MQSATQYLLLITLVLEETCKHTKHEVACKSSLETGVNDDARLLSKVADGVDASSNYESARLLEQKALEDLVTGPNSLIGCFFPLMKELLQSPSVPPVIIQTWCTRLLTVSLVSG